MKFACLLWNTSFPPNSLFEFPHNTLNKEYSVLYVGRSQNSLGLPLSFELCQVSCDCVWDMFINSCLLGYKSSFNNYPLTTTVFPEEVSSAVAYCMLKLHLRLTC